MERLSGRMRRNIALALEVVMGVPLLPRWVSHYSHRFTTHYRLVSTTERSRGAEGEGLVVTCNHRTNEKAPIPEVIRPRMEALGGAA